ncbi:MAG: DNA mismatch repair protein MutL, partial [Methylophagaceae bacterium]
MIEPQRIHPLPLHLANQIAAGEVIERPASVVKELIENSLDAGATDISIHIDGAGSKLIRIRDNGHGIHPDDLPLALSRHATSKLTSTEQLSHIESLGFRGEALPSISSISQLTVSSKQSSIEHAWQFNANNKTLQPTAHPDGTTVEVRDLFFNVPARRHFLKGDKTELNHIVNTLHRLALSQFETSFHGYLSNTHDLKL